MNKTVLSVSLAVIVVFLFNVVPDVWASDLRNMAYIQRGAGRILGSTLAIPTAMVQDSQCIMFPFGIVTGALRGTVQMVGGIVGGVVDVARGGAPYAKYAALAL
ncbi:MAG TPA: hypothetical protein PLX96_06375 [Candidatus Omnitrophota bacterium]|nr:hypothetical protein [Candidatus Omnitrophota bacterium]